MRESPLVEATGPPAPRVYDTVLDVRESPLTQPRSTDSSPLQLTGTGPQQGKDQTRGQLPNSLRDSNQSSEHTGPARQRLHKTQSPGAEGPRTETQGDGTGEEDHSAPRRERAVSTMPKAGTRGPSAAMAKPDLDLQTREQQMVTAGKGSTPTRKLLLTRLRRAL